MSTEYDARRDGRWQRIKFSEVRKGDVLACLDFGERNGQYVQVTSDLYEDGDGPVFKWKPAEMVPLSEAVERVGERNKAWEEMSRMHVEMTGREPGSIQGYDDDDLNAYSLRIRCKALRVMLARRVAELDFVMRVLPFNLGPVEHVKHAAKRWGEIFSRIPQATEPMVSFREPDRIQMTWHGERHYFDLDVYPDGTLEWFYTDKQVNKGSKGSDDGERLTEMSNKMWACLRVVVTEKE